MAIYSKWLPLTQPAAMPFGQTDWSVPRRNPALPPVSDPLNINLFTNPFPFNQTDWLKPFRVPLTQPQPSPALNINLFTNPIPFFQTATISPLSPRPSPGIAQPFNPNLYGVVAVSMPFNQYDWRPGRRPQPQAAAYFPNLILVSVAPGAPTEVHNHPFFATVGQLMGGM